MSATTQWPNSEGRTPSADVRRQSVSGRKVLVTGAAGFLGSNLCRALELADARVYAITRRPSPEVDGPTTWIQADCSNAEALRSVLSRVQPQLIYHLTGHSTGAPDLAAVLPTLQDNLVACVNMLAIAAEVGYERMVLAASLEEPFDNDRPPNSPYAAAKTCCTTYARTFHRLFRAPVTLVRPYMTYGPGQRPEKIIPSIVLSILRGQIPEIGSAQRPVDWVYVDDVVQGMIAAGETTGVEGITIDLGSGKTVTVGDVAERVVALMGRAVSLHYRSQPTRAFEVVRVADTATARERLGWSPKTSLEQGLQSTVDSYCHEFANGRYSQGDGQRQMRGVHSVSSAGIEPSHNL